MRDVIAYLAQAAMTLGVLDAFAGLAKQPGAWSAFRHMRAQCLASGDTNADCLASHAAVRSWLVRQTAGNLVELALCGLALVLWTVAP